MKIICFGWLIMSLLISCGGGSDDNKKSGGNGTDNTMNPDYQKGLSLVAKNKCMTCHQIDEMLTGPPYREVAKKYAGYPDTIVAHLARKIITGGTGIWGNLVMINHPNLSQEDAEAMVKYILLLNK